jgi:hypothetical protein
MANYRKIYTEVHGPLPYDDNGRIYEIHHIDGDHSNNSIDNLRAVTIDEHYVIHYSQKDWGACHAMAIRMGKTPKEISELARKSAYRRVETGSHPFLGGKIQRKRIAEGTHNFQTIEHKQKVKKSNAKRIAEGTHNWLGGKQQRELANKRLKEGTHNFQTTEHKQRSRENAKKMASEGKLYFQSEEHKRVMRERVKNGNHNLVGNVTCRTKDGKIVQVERDVYYSQIGSPFEWEYVTVHSKEGKRRKREAGGD